MRVRGAARRARRAALGPGLALVVGALVAAAAGASPHQDYVLQCMGCHGADGRGAPDAIPSLVDRPGRLLGVPGGRAFLVRVPGVAQSALEAPALAAVLNWMLRTFSATTLPADFAPFTAEEVATLRRRPLLDVDAERARLLGALGSGGAQAP